MRTIGLGRILLMLLAVCVGCKGGESQQKQTEVKGSKAGTAAVRGGNGDAASAAHNTSSQAGQPGTGHTWHMKKAEAKAMIGYDAMPQWGIQAVPQRQVTALSMLVPTDWQFQGGPMQTTQVSDCNFTVGRLGFVVFNADKTAGMVSIPAAVSLWSNDQGVLQSIQQENQQFNRMQMCRVEQPQPLAQRIGAIAKALNKDTEATGPMEPVPGMAEKLDVAVRQANEQLASQGAQVAVEAGRLPIRGTTKEDTGEGYLTVMQVVRSQRLPNGATVWTVDTPMQVATFAPRGKYRELDAMYRAMMDSVWVNPEYTNACLQVSANLQSIKMQTKQRLNQIYQQMAVDNMNAARQQAAIRQDAQQYASHVYSSVAANRSAALQHSSQQFSLYMGDQALYHDPTTGGTVQLPSGSTHAWASQTGNTSEYILTDSASFNPNGQVGSANWTPMREVR